MKSLWKAVLDGLTFKDLAGRRQPRTFTVLAGLLLILFVLVLIMTWSVHYDVMSEVRATPRTVEVKTEAAQQPPTPAPSPAAVECPTGAEKWSLSPVYEGTLYDVIQPACVYQGLERTVAWALAVREGYSRQQATDALGFRDMPMRQLDHVTIPASNNETSLVPVSFIPPDPDFTEWRLKPDGSAAVTYALRGCFRTTTVVANRIETWGGNYPVICLVVEDAENTHIVYSLNGHTYTAAAKPMRSFLLFGYVSDHQWVWLGTQDDPKLEITDPEQNGRDRATIAKLYDSQPWDARWLETAYGLSMQTPPLSWPSSTDEADKQAILSALSAVPEGAKP